MTTIKDVENFYDEYSSRQQKVAYNERHMYVYKALVNFGLTKKSKVLEIGCGIGVISSLILKKISKGQLIAMDLSSKSVEMAKNNCKKYTNAKFFAGDIVTAAIPSLDYDFIIMADVVEHLIPEQRIQAFKNIAGAMSSDTQLIVNIPNAPIHEYIINNAKESLQIIDEPVQEHELSAVLNANGLKIDELKTYDIWLKDEYQMYKIRKKESYKYVELK